MKNKESLDSVDSAQFIQFLAPACIPLLQQ